MPDAHPEDVRLKAVNDYLATKATAEGTTLEAVCLKHGISISSLSRYLREYREAHGVPVHERRGPLKYARLTKDQRAVVVEHALAHPASTLVELAQWATTRFERKVGVATVRYALHASGISKRRLVAQAKSDRPPTWRIRLGMRHGIAGIRRAGRIDAATLRTSPMPNGRCWSRCGAARLLSSPATTTSVTFWMPSGTSEPRAAHGGSSPMTIRHIRRSMAGSHDGRKTGSRSE